MQVMHTFLNSPGYLAVRIFRDNRSPEVTRCRKHLKIQMCERIRMPARLTQKESRGQKAAAD